MIYRTFLTIAALSFTLPLGADAASMNFENRGDIEQNTPVIVSQHPNNFGERRKHGERGFKKMLEQLDLTSEQSQEIEAIETKSDAERDSLHQQLEPLMTEMRSLMASDASSEQLREQHQKIRDLHQQMGDQRFETMLQIREVLTPEQRQQMQQLMEQNRPERGR